jgi:hypothetical protein
MGRAAVPAWIPTEAAAVCSSYMHLFFKKKEGGTIGLFFFFISCVRDVWNSAGFVAPLLGHADD